MLQCAWSKFLSATQNRCTVVRNKERDNLLKNIGFQKKSISLNCSIRIADSPIVTYALQISGLILVSLCQLSVKHV